MSGLSGQRNIQLLLAKQVQALVDNGLHYSENDYDLDRYTNLEKVAIHMISLITGMSNETIQMVTPEKNGFRTPKVDVRCVVFNDQDMILMIKEKADLLWSLPGGWCYVKAGRLLECKAESYNITTGMETLDVGFFPQYRLPELSTSRNTKGQIDKMFDFHFDRLHWPVID